MKVYHGSYTKIDKIDLEKCEIGKDFGRGFYVTRLKEQAEIWAKRKGKRYKNDGFITEFDFNENGFTYFHFKVLRFSEYNDEWLDFVAMNRNPRAVQPTHDYDIIEGPVADDKISIEINNYLANRITREEFLGMLIHRETSHQICFCTGRSLQMLDYVDKQKTISFSIEDIGESLIEQLMLDRQIDEMKAADIFYSSATFTQLANTDTQLYEKEWQEIYQMLKNELGV
jgi:arsenate reductase-like glutaredoxin family protein